MSDYTLAVSWSGKDALSDSDANKVISGDDFNTEFTTVQTAVNSKVDAASPTLTGTPAAPTAATSTDSTQIATTAFVKNVLETYIYPVGSIYMNMAVATNPGTLLGFGTWEAYATGQVLVGYEASGTFDSLDESLGAESVSGGSGTSGSTAISISQMPSHNHINGSYDRLLKQDGSLTAASMDSSAGEPNLGSSAAISATGGGAGHTHTTPSHSHSVLQPSVTVHMWKRTA
jgi:hypothetical protein